MQLKTKTALMSIALAALINGCGGGGGGGTPIPANRPPEILVSGIDDFENKSTEFNLYAADPDNDAVSNPRFTYSATNIPLTEIAAGSYQGNLPALASGKYPYTASATDSKGLEGTLSGEINRYASELNGDIALQDTLESWKLASKISDYWINSGFTLDGIICSPDALIFTKDSRFIMVWYQGESDGQHTDQKAVCAKYGYPVIQINPCPKSEIADKISVAESLNWQTGEY